VAAWVEELGAMLPTAQSLQLVVALRAEDASVELKVDAPGYPRAAVERLAEEVRHSGGTFVELWRLPKAERDAFRATTLTGGTTYSREERAAAALALKQHLDMLSAKGTHPASAPLSPLDAPVGLTARAAHTGRGTGQEGEEPVRPPPPPAPGDDARRVPLAAPGGPQRRGRRFAVKLELEFRTELEFVREHALNISNGGLFLRTAHRPPPDSVVTVDVKLPNGERLQGDAVVVHVVDDPYTGGVGLAFLSDDPTFARTLDDYLASLAGGAG
jgi:uncharacterized protein (TIGR02266 family)